MEGLGKHVLVELFHCDELRIDSVKEVKEVMLRAAELCKTTVIQHFFHKFSPYGISGVVLIAESHLTIHTWPEHAYAAVDLFLCGDHDWHVVVEHLKGAFGAERCSVFELTRGIIPEDVCQREIG
jgi:S-adenosylmethionine decarboxylase proenzyme